MPFKYVSPELFFEYSGIKFYHQYQNDRFENRLDYWYTTDLSEAPEYRFMIQRLFKRLVKAGAISETEKRKLDFDDVETHKIIIRAAVDHQMIKVPEQEG